jgi:hypothetical protein
MSTSSLPSAHPSGLSISGHATPLTRSADLFVAMALIAGALMMGLEAWYLLAAKLPYDVEGYVVGRDFVNTWMGARIALTGDPTPWFDFKTYNAALQAMWGTPYPDHIWSYPPHLLLFTWPFGFMSYMAGFVLWVAVGLAVYLWAGLEGRLDRTTLWLMVISPAVVLNLFTGQNGFFTAALLIGGLTMLDRRPILAGVLFGILTIKPQLGVLLPIMLVLTGRWRVIGSAAATVAVLLGFTTLAFGPGVWTAFRDVAMTHQAHVIARGTGVFVAMMPTVFMNARAADMPMGLAWTLQAVVSVAAVAAVVWAYWKPRDPLLSRALLITATFVVTPYVFNYDMVVFGWLFAGLAARRDNAIWDYALMFLVWTLPVTTIVLGLLGIPGSALAFAALVGRLACRLRQSPRAYGLAAAAPSAKLSIS